MVGPIVHWSIGREFSAGRREGTRMRQSIGLAALLLTPVLAEAQTPAGAREVFQKVCGACQATETATSQRRTRAQWQESINSMVARGAKGTEEELSLILDYL